MRVKGLQKTTLIDFPGLIACTVFTPGCNFKCGFCYNAGIVFDDKSIQDIPEKEFFEFLEKRKKVLEGVVVSGGEPTMQKDLPEFLARVKSLGFKAKLDTNGSNPEMLKEILEKRLADYVAMDIKGTFENYERICGVKVELEKIKQSIELLKSSKIDYEFRTTLHPKLQEKQDIEKIGEAVKGAKLIVLQQFSAVEGLIDEKLAEERLFSREDFEEFGKILEKSVKKVEFRNLD
ncbi:MAG: anaerobic ribonucleoside-triphosphate reductase activating protein [Candidatus Diapherotrites archaeon]|uniref:Anaerobic ribonucleoside-triphosphate reductase activating protein n=1 Tax=Candidatus Iainarchaeum sp. TaxID=3101447 RepID=A0A7J4JW41_9ARCH|nr:MAG: pyruvate formate lyase activating enzyme [archaeon GW2011_AR21]MBS3058372.1 anaerobic ribonucleoside-triphosphate reductase activating protein [Candidatus Diapherotrites archaeon]HIH22002.1 anaerobic ribonucleoside-triphosphate reductase activating protein [Candidatus Diapherotrites archaeon]